MTGSAHFLQRVAQWERVGIVKRWNGRIRVLRQGEIRIEKRSDHRHLADGLEISWATQVAGIRQSDRQKVLVDDNGNDLDAFDGMVMSAPAEQPVYGPVTPISLIDSPLSA